MNSPGNSGLKGQARQNVVIEHDFLVSALNPKEAGASSRQFERHSL